MLALAALIAVAAVAPAELRAAGRQPIVLTLLGLGALSALSAAWTIGSPEDALRWGAVIAGYAAFAACGFVAARATGPVPIALLFAAAAVICGLIGIFGVAARTGPIAERVDGAWRAEGPLQYSPALGLLQLAALPVVLRWMVRDRSMAATLCCLVAGAAISLVGTRTLLGLALVALGIAIAWPRATLGTGRPITVAAAALVVGSGAAANAIAGSYAPPFETGGDAPRVIGLAAMLVFGLALWTVQRGRFDEAGALRRGRERQGLAVVAVPLVIAIGAAALTPDSGPQQEPVSGFAHGRLEVWAAALDSGLDRPFDGSGALTFLEASLKHQDSPPTAFAHNLVLEEWTELGALGAAASLLLLTLLVLAALHADREALWLLGPGAIGFAVSAMLDWPWHVPASAAGFAIGAGALAACSKDR